MNGWKVVDRNSGRVSQTFDLKADAMIYARSFNVFWYPSAGPLEVQSMEPGDRTRVDHVKARK